jgi:hypothetical protein
MNSLPNFCDSRANLALCVPLFQTVPWPFVPAESSIMYQETGPVLDGHQRLADNAHLDESLSQVDRQNGLC